MTTKLVAAIAAAGALLLPAPAHTQTPDAAAPTALSMVTQGGWVPVRGSSVAPLKRVIALKLTDARISEALDQIGRRGGVRIAYGDDVLAAKVRVTLEVGEIAVVDALIAVLEGTGLEAYVSLSGKQVLVRGAQGGSVAGRVADSLTGRGVQGALVSIEGTRWAMRTDTEGSYRFADVAAGSYTLSARRIGYARASRAVTVVQGEELAADFALQAVPSTLNEVVVTATGEQRLLELGHVVGRINADSLVKVAPVSSLSELLTARVPGLQVFQAQGTVGGQTTVRIRGPNSILRDNEPIVVIDGVRYTTALRPQFIGPADVEPSNPLNDINPNDIETIEVVKGPSAATVYGTDAVNGVLVITTKRGVPGPARWNVYAKGTMTTIPKQHYPDIYWGWGTVDGVPNNPTTSCTLSSLAFGSCTRQDSITVLPNPLNDPKLTLFASKPSYEYGVNVAGGREDLRYYFSGDFEDATGPIQMPRALAEQLQQQRGLPELPEEWREPNTLTKLNLRSNVKAVGERADVLISAAYVKGDTRTLAFTEFQSPYVGAFQTNPTGPYTARFNPAERFARTVTEGTERFLGNVSGHWRPRSWLTTRATVGLDLLTSNHYSLARRGDAPNDPDASTGAVEDTRARQVATSATVDAAATARRGRLSARTTVGVNYTRTLYSSLVGYGMDLPSGGTSVQTAVNRLALQRYQETVVLGSYIEGMLGLNDRLFLTGALRVDGASTFGRDYDAATYPKVSASWLLSEEPFLPRVPGLDELRLRYAFGASGQQPDPAWAKPVFSPGQMFLNGQTVSVVELEGVGNPAIRPERVREHEFGFDVAALASRLRLESTWFRRRTVDQLTWNALQPGLASIGANVGLTKQRGFEAQLTARVLDTRLVSWDLTFLHSSHTTELVDLGGGIGGELFGFGLEGGWKQGYPLGSRFGRVIVSYADLNGDGILTGEEVQWTDTAVYLGQSTPPRTQTLTTVLGLFERRLRLSATLEHKAGFTQVNALRCPQNCRGHVDPSTPLAEQARLLDPPVEAGDFTRFREASAALDLPASLTRALRLRSAILVLSARNLALWTHFSGPDPESAALGRSSGFGGGSLAGGTAVGIPQGRVFSLRLDLGF